MTRSKSRPVAVVTGMGAFTPLGQTVAELWDGLVAGRSGIGPITLLDTTDLPVRIAGEVRGFQPADHMDAKAARRMGRFAQFAVAAARQAVEDAELTIDESNRDDIAVVMNTGGGGIGEIASEEIVRCIRAHAGSAR